MPKPKAISKQAAISMITAVLVIGFSILIAKYEHLNVKTRDVSVPETTNNQDTVPGNDARNVKTMPVFKDVRIEHAGSYSNSELGFELTIPKSWIVEENYRDESINQVNISGDDYFIAINRKFGVGLPPDETYQNYTKTFGKYKYAVDEEDTDSSDDKFFFLARLLDEDIDLTLRVSGNKNSSQKPVEDVLKSLKIK